MLPSRVTHKELDVPLSPGEVARRIASGMAHVRSLLLSPAWGVSEEFVGNIDDHRFRMRVRHGYSNGYTRLLFGTIEPRGKGSRVRIEFKDVRFVVVLMNVISAAIGLAGLGYVASVLRYGAQGGVVEWSAVVAAIAGPAIVLACFLAVEIVGRALGRRDERRMREHIDALLEI